MKRFFTFTLLYTCSALLALHAQTAADAAAQEQVGEDARLIKIATLNSVEANQEFQRNVRIMQLSREQAIKIKEEIDNTIDPEKKKELEQLLEDTINKINENNKKMIEAYGFSLNRDYVMVLEKSHIYMQVSEEEAQKIKEELEKQGIQPEALETQN